MLVSLHPRFAVHRFAGPAIAAGAAVFSGSIFALTVAKMKGLGDKCVLLNLYAPGTASCLLPYHRVRILGPITPLGGSILIAG